MGKPVVLLAMLAERFCERSECALDKRNITFIWYLLLFGAPESQGKKLSFSCVIQQMVKLMHHLLLLFHKEKELSGGS